MPWRSLGIISPTLLTWQPTPESAIGEVFRVRQTWEGDWPGTGFVQLAALYPDGGRYGYERIYPDRDNKLFLMPVPKSLSDVGLLTRAFILKLSSNARVYAVANWELEIEEYTPDLDADGNPIQLIDGGTYDGL